MAAIQRQIALLDNVGDIAEQANQSARADTGNQRIEKMMQEKRREKGRIRALKDGLYEDFKADILTREDYSHMKAKYDKQARQIDEATKNLENELLQREKKVDCESGALAQFLKHKNILQLDRALLVELVEAIYIHENKDVTVVFRFAGTPDSGAFQSAGSTVHVEFCNEGKSLKQALQAYLLSKRSVAL